ncbi:hypothetical protein NPIL_174071 [Nephila pilipes]|uniref:Uncharacterized protein n=1 Tax=Nephila pilipes TaxID=299642 RepID=A0A8X6TCJ4_NEPPI|nr:hypothetical protein NPIL_174071 [Nephila pilipes]
MQLFEDYEMSESYYISDAGTIINNHETESKPESEENSEKEKHPGIHPNFQWVSLTENEVLTYIFSTGMLLMIAKYTNMKLAAIRQKYKDPEKSDFRDLVTVKVPIKSKTTLVVSSVHSTISQDTYINKKEINIFYNSTKYGFDALDEKCIRCFIGWRSRWGQ